MQADTGFPAPNEPAMGFVRDDEHVFPVRVYYEDTDVGGVVYYANYLRFAERARSEMLRYLGCPLGNLQAGDGVTIAVRRCEADYFVPARFDDALEIRTGNVEMEAASLWLDQAVWRGDEELARLRVRLACLKQNGRPSRVPETLRTALRPFVKGAAKTAQFSPNSAVMMRSDTESGGQVPETIEKKEEEQV